MIWKSKRYIQYQYYNNDSYLVFSFSDIKRWHDFLHGQVMSKKISRSVFKPVQHYLCHIPFIVRNQGPLRAYSTRSMERAIGKFSKLIKSKVKGGKNASNLIQRFAMHGYIKSMLNIEALINAIRPRPYNDSSYDCLPSDENGPQLWQPFQTVLSIVNVEKIEGVPGARIIKALKKYYSRFFSLAMEQVQLSTTEIKAACSLWRDSYLYASCMSRRIRRATSRSNHFVMFTSAYRT
jgi:hypothetical protein